MDEDIKDMASMERIKSTAFLAVSYTLVSRHFVSGQVGVKRRRLGLILKELMKG